MKARKTAKQKELELKNPGLDRYPPRILAMLKFDGFEAIVNEFLPEYFGDHRAAYDAAERVFKRYFGDTRYSTFATYSSAKSKQRKRHKK